MLFISVRRLHYGIATAGHIVEYVLGMIVRHGIPVGIYITFRCSIYTRDPGDVRAHVMSLC